jgi:hypothetical protein
MLNTIFSNNFYWQFKSSNCEELNSHIGSISPEESGEFGWGETCEVYRNRIKVSEWTDLIVPNINKLSDILQKSFKCKINEGWINFYNRGFFQEIHAHSDCDFVMVYFPQTPKEGYSRFYFYDRNEPLLTYQTQKLLGTVGCWYPDIQGGDFLVFPHSMLHGVTPHKHEDIRASLSINLKIETL